MVNKNLIHSRVLISRVKLIFHYYKLYQSFEVKSFFITFLHILTSMYEVSCLILICFLSFSSLLSGVISLNLYLNSFLIIIWLYCKFYFIFLGNGKWMCSNNGKRMENKRERGEVDFIPLHLFYFSLFKNETDTH